LSGKVAFMSGPSHNSGPGWLPDRDFGRARHHAGARD